MANVDRPNGFRFGKTLNGAPVAAMIRRYEAADRSADTTNNHGDIYLGDPVTLVNGRVQVANSNDPVLGVAVATGADGDTNFGNEGYFNADNLQERYLAADQDGIVAVIPAENSLFEIQTASDLDLLPGSMADMNTAAATAHGSRTTSRSTVELVVAANNDVRVVEQIVTPDNESDMANARHLVQFVDIVNSQS